MALLKSENGLINDMNMSLIYNTLNEVYCTDNSKGIDPSKITILEDKIIYGGNLKVRQDKLHISSLKVLSIPFEVTGYFTCFSCYNITSLEGAPIKVGLDFCCSCCKKLKNLEGAPKEVGGNFDCGYCHNIESLEGSPEGVSGNFYCGGNERLTTLKGSPKFVGGKFDCNFNPGLRSLEGITENIKCLDHRWCKNLIIR